MGKTATEARRAFEIEFTLETHQGKTRLRLVHAGFGHGAAWDNEVEGITEGWQAELASLRHYLQRHRGRDRVAGHAWLTTTVPREAAWARLLGPGGFQVSPAALEGGQPYEVVVSGGERFTGTVALNLPGQTLAETVRELDDGWFRLLTWKDGAGNTGVWAWLATYTGNDERVREFRERVREFRERAQEALE